MLSWIFWKLLFVILYIMFSFQNCRLEESRIRKVWNFICRYWPCPLPTALKFCLFSKLMESKLIDLNFSQLCFPLSVVFYYYCNDAAGLRKSLPENCEWEGKFVSLLMCSEDRELLRYLTRMRVMLMCTIMSPGPSVFTSKSPVNCSASDCHLLCRGQC